MSFKGFKVIAVMLALSWLLSGYMREFWGEIAIKKPPR
jgi:hypothetical protein